MSALREIIARFGVSFDDSALKKGNAAVNEGIGLLQKIAPLFAIGAVVKFTGDLFNQADALNKQSRALGLGVGELQAWNYAATLSGVSAETLTGTLAKLGSGKFDKGLAALGVTTKDASGQMRGSTDILDDVAENLSKIQNPAERQRKAVAVLGKSYAQMLPLLEGGAAGLAKMREEFAELGGGFDDDFAKNSEEFNDNLTRVKTIGKGLAITILGAVMPVLRDLSTHFVRVVKPIREVLQNSNALNAGLLLLGGKGVLVLSKALGPLGASFRTLLTRMLPIVAAFLILEDALSFLNGDESVIGDVIESIFGEEAVGKVRAFVKDVVKDTKQFFSDVGKSWEEFKGGVKLIWFDLMNYLKNTWVGAALGKMFDTFIAGTVGGVLWLGESFNKMWMAVIDGAMKAVGAIGNVLETIPGARKLLSSLADAATAPGRAINNAIGAGASAVGGAAVGAFSAGPVDQKAVDRQRTAIIDRSDAAARANSRMVTVRAAQENGSGTRYGANGQPITNNTTISVTVPPGTPAQVARDVGNAAAAGAAKGNNRAAKAAVSPGKG